MQDINILQSVKHEIKLSKMEKMESWTIDDKWNVEVNARANNTLICVFCPEKFNCVSTCKTAKEIWHKLKVTHEGTKQVKETKINLLIIVAKIQQLDFMTWD